MTEVVINACYGGFGLSHEAVMAYAERKNLELYVEATSLSLAPYCYYKVPPEQYHALEEELRANGENFKRLNEKDWYFSDRDIARDDPDLVAVVRELGDEASDKLAKLSIVEIPDGVEWQIEEYDGYEHVAEKHRTWA